MAGFQIDCVYCPPPNNMLCKWEAHLDQKPEDFAAAWKATTTAGPGGGPLYSRIVCSGCGAEFQIVDDGVPLEEGGMVAQDNRSAPRIDSLSVTSGNRLGGEAIYVNGSALEIGTLVVKFGGKEVAQIASREPLRARVVTPPARYTLNVDSLLTPGVNFVVGEGVIGATSGARGVVYSVLPLLIDNPTRAFTAAEEVRGDASGARVLLSTPPYSSTVDVTVENENGQRVDGGTLAGGFTYA